MGKLSAKFIETASTSGYHPDGDNLYLQVKPSGAKSWMLATLARWQGPYFCSSRYLSRSFKRRRRNRTPSMVSAPSISVKPWRLKSLM